MKRVNGCYHQKIGPKTLLHPRTRHFVFRLISAHFRINYVSVILQLVEINDLLIAPGLDHPSFHKIIHRFFLKKSYFITFSFDENILTIVLTISPITRAYFAR